MNETTMHWWSPGPYFWGRLRHRVFYWVAKACIGLVGVLRLFRDRASKTAGSVTLCIESGAAGWELIEFEELYESAREYLRESKVTKVTIGSRDTYFAEVKAALKRHQPSHYYFDPRGGQQRMAFALLDALRLGMLLRWNGVTPLALLTDFHRSRWRTQCAVVTAVSGLTITLMAPSRVSGLFPHRRLLGPAMMPLSVRTVESLREGRRAAPSHGAVQVLFSGSLYEPRRTTILNLREALGDLGVEMTLRSREVGGPRIPNEDYWRDLLRADVIVTTADLNVTDDAESLPFPHLIYRYTEALAAGGLLVAPALPGLDRWLSPSIDYVAYSSVSEAAQLIVHYLADPRKRAEIAQHGSETVAALSRTHAFWTTIDAALGPDAMLG